MEIYGLTDVGSVRSENQDAFATGRLADDVLYAVVCDGMGGASGGGIASRLAADLFAERMEKQYRPGMPEASLFHLMESAVDAANVGIFDKAAENPDLAGMGTTLVAVVIDRENAVAVHVGDSRLYRLEKDTLKQITTDHSVVQEMIDRGQLTEAQARSHPRKHFITRAIGVEGTVRCEFDTFTVSPDTRLLLCTDGLTNMLSDDEIVSLLQNGSPETVPGALIDAANTAGGEDNITAVIFA